MTSPTVIVTRVTTIFQNVLLNFGTAIVWKSIMCKFNLLL